MAKTTAPKSPAKSSAGTKGKSKRAAGTGRDATAPRNVMPSHVPDADGRVHGRAAARIRVPSATRHPFAKIPHVLEIPNLIELQKASFEWFKTEGLAEAFASISPIKDFTGNLILEFGEHSARRTEVLD